MPAQTNASSFVGQPKSENCCSIVSEPKGSGHRHRPQDLRVHYFVACRYRGSVMLLELKNNSGYY